MSRKLSIVRSAVLCALAASALSGLDLSKLKPTGYVNDFAHVLSPAGKQRLESYCANLEQATGVQMAIVLVDSLDGDPIDDDANTLFRQWGIGKKGKDEGILLFFAVKDHKDRAEIGYGLEPVVSDGYAGQVLRGIRPILRQGDYAGAILAAADEFGQKIAQAKGVTLAPAGGVRTARPVRTRVPVIPIPLIILGFWLVLYVIGKISGSGRGGGSGTGFLAGMLLGNMMNRRSGGSWGGGGFGGGSSGGGGWGGFGGGDSGGGGASSDW